MVSTSLLVFRQVSGRKWGSRARFSVPMHYVGLFDAATPMYWDAGGLPPATATGPFPWGSKSNPDVARATVHPFITQAPKHSQVSWTPCQQCWVLGTSPVASQLKGMLGYQYKQQPWPSAMIDLRCRMCRPKSKVVWCTIDTNGTLNPVPSRGDPG